MSITQQLDRVPPQNLEAEQGVLGSMLLDRDAIARVVESLRAEDFYRDAHRVIYVAMTELFERGEPVDLITVTNRLAAQGKIEDIGGATYLASLPNVVPTAANVEFYGSIVMEKSMLRQLISAGTHIAALGYEAADDVAALIDSAEKLVFGIAARRNVQDFQAIKEILKESFDKIDKRYQEKGTVTGVATGFTDLDMLTSGLQSSDMVIVAARPSVGKCLTADAEIVLADGSVATIEEICRRRHGSLLTLGPDRRLRFTQPSAFVDDGRKPVFCVTTRLGRRVETTAAHPFLTPDGWLPLAALRIGDRVAVPRRLDVFGDKPMRECEVTLLAYLVQGGALTGRQSALTNTARAVLRDFSAAARAFGGVRWPRQRDRGGRRAPALAVSEDAAFVGRQRCLLASRLRAALGTPRGARITLGWALNPSPTALRFRLRDEALPTAARLARLSRAIGLSHDGLAPYAGPAVGGCSLSPIVPWLKALGLWGKGAADKHLPAAVFTLPKPQSALFLNRLFAAGGWVGVNARTRSAQIGYSSASERSVRQIQHLLVRFGIIAAVRRRSVRCRQDRRGAWGLSVTDPESIRTFAREIGIFHRERQLLQALRVLAPRAPIPNRETMAAAEDAGLQASTSGIHVGVRVRSRHRPPTVATALRDGGAQRPVQRDVCWDEIVAIQPAGEKQVYDLTVPETHNFVANDICVHNTTFSLNIAQHAALTHKIPVAIFSLETSKEQLVQRILCSEAQVDNSKLRTGFLADEDWRKLARAMGGLSEAPIFIDDSATLSVIEMRAKARKLKAEHGLGLIVIDYIQLIQSYRRTENRTQELSEIARNIKSLAKELDIPIIAVSQLSRAVEALGQKRPMLSHLRESGEIEQVSDLVLFLYREDYYDQEKAQKDNKENICEVIIAKHRNGPIGTVELYFHKEHSRFDNLAKQR